MLTGEASNAYKAFLREKNIPYIIAGENTIDAKLALEKLKILFHMVFVMLGGGGFRIGHLFKMDYVMK